MARGITQQDVDAAIAELLALRIRPTIDSLREHMGTGSRNTIHKFLNAWWDGLGERLEAKVEHLALPMAPPEVTALAEQFWAQAIAAGKQSAVDEVQREVEDIKAGLAKRESALDRERADLHEQVQAGARAQERMEARMLEAREQLAAAHERMAKLESDLGAACLQRDALAGELGELKARWAGMQDALAAEREQLAAAAASNAAIFEANERRANEEIDRARQTVAAVRKDASDAARTREKEIALLRAKLEDAQTRLDEARQEADQQRTLALERGRALEVNATTLARMEGMLARITASGTTSKPTAKKPSPVARPARQSTGKTKS